MRAENVKLNELIDEITENNEIWKGMHKTVESELEKLNRITCSKDAKLDQFKEEILVLEKHKAHLESKVGSLAHMELDFERSEHNNRMISQRAHETMRL